MRYLQGFALSATLLITTAVSAQQVSVGGWVKQVDTAKSTITIRTTTNPRTIQVGPNAVIWINGVISRLDQIPANGDINVTTERGPTGVLTATQISVHSSGQQPAAAAPPGSIIRGTVVGMNTAANTVTLRTTSGDHVYSLGTAPIMINGVRGSSRSFAVGRTVQIQRALPTDASTEYITQSVWVLPSQSRVAGYRTMASSTSGRVTVQSRTRGYRTTYRSHRAASRHRSRLVRQHRPSRIRRQAMQSTVGIRAAAALAGTAPAGMPIVVAGDTMVLPWTPVAAGLISTTSGALISPGGVYVTPGVADISVPPIYAVPGAPLIGAIVGTAPATGASDARSQAAASTNSGAAGIADVRRQAGAISGAAVSGVANPRKQSVVPATPGVTPGVFGRPGFVGPRIVTPMAAPRVPVAPAVPVAPR